MPATKPQATAAISHLKDFISPNQLAAIGQGCYGEEKQFFFDKLVELADRVNTMAKTYEQDGKGDDAIVYLHYFRGGMDWFITEKDMGDEQLQAFGLADLGMGPPELGYISLPELFSVDAELDLHFDPKPLREVKAKPEPTTPSPQGFTGF